MIRSSSLEMTLFTTANSIQIFSFVKAFMADSDKAFMADSDKVNKLV